MENKQKIALLTYSLSSGGLERVVSNLSFLFDELSYEVDIIVVNSAVTYPYKGKITCFNLNSKSFFGKIKTYYRLYQFIKSQKYTCIIDHRYRLNLLSEIVWQKVICQNQKVYHYIHSSFVYNYIFKLSLVNSYLFGSSQIICVSKGILDKVKIKYPKLNLTYMYNPIEISSLTNQELMGNYIVSVARMTNDNVKQVDVLLECFAKSILPEQNFKLVVVGNGETIEQMKLYAKKLDIADEVIFTGFCNNPYSYLKYAKYTVLCSKYEGLPTVLIESLLVGTPVVSYDCETGPNEIIVNYKNGILVKNQDKQELIKAMNLLISDTMLYNELKENAVLSVEKFSYSTISKQWQVLLNDTL